MEDEKRPVISEKEVSWFENVAAHVARRRYLESQTEDAAVVLPMLAMARLEKVRVGRFMLEPYSLATSMLLEELKNPLEVGGAEVSNADFGVALLCFGERELLEDMVATHGAEKARELVYASPNLRGILAGLNAETIGQVKAYLQKQFTSVRLASGGGGIDEAAEAAVREAEEAARGKE
jgi:hypothetical protein